MYTYQNSTKTVHIKNMTRIVHFDILNVSSVDKSDN